MVGVVYQRLLPPEVQQRIGQVENTTAGAHQRYFALLRQDDGIVSQNQFGKQWEQTKVTTRLVVSYFNWIWEHTRLGNTAAFRAGLASDSWTWNDFAPFPTLC